ncbi:hypothetical protein PoB_001856100 [Plakobranchus ocellatus]|uniref:Uncharacterized protein n=1 Tax=Plakobranchus ocellatus TaxID=259542 RepID=A0AAV3Z836_9GAST|nr:hypothetical protein PoB_001856100 [Plakobranchus ocellatus]
MVCGSSRPAVSGRKWVRTHIMPEQTPMMSPGAHTACATCREEMMVRIFLFYLYKGNKINASGRFSSLSSWSDMYVTGDTGNHGPPFHPALIMTNNEIIQLLSLSWVVQEISLKKKLHPPNSMTAYVNLHDKDTFFRLQ